MENSDEPGLPALTDHPNPPRLQMLVRHGASSTAANQALFWAMPPLLLAAENGSLLAIKVKVYVS